MLTYYTNPRCDCCNKELGELDICWNFNVNQSKTLHYPKTYVLCDDCYKKFVDFMNGVNTQENKPISGDIINAPDHYKTVAVARFDREEDAKSIRNSLISLTESIGRVSEEDLMWLLGAKGLYSQYYGWNKETASEITVVRCYNGWLLYVPKTVRL